MAITKTDLWKAADELDAEGIRPTLAAVRKKIGGGSFTTISEAMSEWRGRRQAAALPRHDPAPPAVMAQLAEAGNALWASALAQANARLEDERKRLDAQKNAMSERLAEAVELADALTLENEHLRARVAQLEPVERERERERDKLAGQLSEVKRRSSEELARCMEKANRRDTEASEARREAKAANENAARLQGQLEALKEQAARLTAALGAGARRPGSDHA